MDRWPLGNVLRKIGCGTADYDQVFRELFSAPAIRAVLTGVYKTTRNILTDKVFGINWEVYGRYPAVILKEKRDYCKQSIAAPLGIDLDVAPTKDGNHRLVIYTAFDFRKGRGLIGRAFWKVFRALFPEYAHDVFWNHAICCIKGEAEKRAGNPT